MTTDQTARPGIVPQIVLHGFTAAGAKAGGYITSNIDGPTDVTRFATSVSWTDMVTEPFGSIQIQLAMPVAFFRQIMPGHRPFGGEGEREPATGFWVVLSLPNDDEMIEGGYSAVSLGYCVKMSVDIRAVPTTGATMATVSIQCESWVGAMKRNAFFLAPGTSYVKDGSSYDLREWADKMMAIAKGLVGERPGLGLARVFPDLAKQLLPTTLAEGKHTIGDSVVVVHDRETCAKYAPLRLFQHLQVPGIGTPAAGNPYPQGTTWSFLANLYGAQVPGVELFASLEWPYVGNAPSRKAVPSENTGNPIYGRPYSAHHTIGRGYAPGNPVTRALGGARPVLMYRMKPTLMTPINKEKAEEVQRQQTADNDPDHYLYTTTIPASEIVGENQLPVYSYPNIQDYSAYVWEASDLYTANWSYSEDERVNMVQISTPYKLKSAFQDHRFSGIPVLSDDDITKHGLRLLTVEWPFLPPEGTTDANILDVQTAMNEYLWMARATSPVFFGRGSVKGVYKPRTKAGHYAKFSWSDFNAPAWAYSVKEVGGFSGYINSVTHQVSVSGTGAVTASTSLQLDRIGAKMEEGVFINYPPSVTVKDPKGPSFIDPDTGNPIYGKLEYNNDGTVTFVAGEPDA